MHASREIVYIGITGFNESFSAVGLEADFLRVRGDNFGGLKPVCANNRWDNKGTILNAKVSRNSRGFP